MAVHLIQLQPSLVVRVQWAVPPPSVNMNCLRGKLFLFALQVNVCSGFAHVRKHRDDSSFLITGRE